MDTHDRDAWRARLRALCDTLRDAVHGALVSHSTLELSRPVRAGAGDVTFALDDICERAVEAWADEVARAEPFSLLTEDSGWRHFGPGVAGGGGFDHGGPRIALDPVDGTRNVMADLRPAWTVVSFCGPGKGQPGLADVEYGLLSELPTTRAGRFRRVWAEAGGPCRMEEAALAPGGAPPTTRVLTADGDDRPDHGYFPFFRYDAALRPALATLEADFFRRLEQHEGAALHHCYDDQWCCGAGQLVSLMEGTYRMLADVRPLMGARQGLVATAGHPYDVAGAILCARAAGCVVLDAAGAPLDFPLDCTTPLDIVAYANPATAARLGPHLAAALEAARPSAHR
jgi:fructose-1,6-bisphosphatase/inositol monophosphatase family enzyme